MTTQCGIARNSAAATQFLDSCEAVIEYSELDDEWLEFSYDDAIEVSVVPDHLVWFDEMAAPAAAIAALNSHCND